MKRNSNLSRTLMAFAVFFGWRAQAETRELSRDQFIQAGIPNNIVVKLATLQILLMDDRDGVCFDYAGAEYKANGDEELLSYIYELQQITAGSSVIIGCKAIDMQGGSQAVGLFR